MTPGQWRGCAGYGGAIFALHIGGAAALVAAARAHPALLGMGFLAYTLGLRHAFDADHIAAIDNVVRKLVRDRRSPLGVGFYFSIGHSSVVFLMAAATVLVTHWTQRSLPYLQTVGGLIGITVSGGFLLLIGVLNLFIWLDIYLIFQRMRRGHHDAEELEGLLLSRGLVMRVASPLFRLITRDWHVYPLGMVFGLGFDTASEVALLALAAGAAASALPVWGVLALPLLFGAGMSLMDTSDGIFMTTAYRWAFATPIRKVYYNLTVTGLSVVAALLIGGIELAQAIARALGLTAGVWGGLAALDLGRLGYLLVALFVLTWSLSYGAWKVLRLEERQNRPA
ncbi:MAG TPA: HoxN/HupN/NixA family nickel/cobalt transporter [bacterium]|nr:HoxN/HupN/NixA family nickel/cobalt transporter [bacterium]